MNASNPIFATSERFLRPSVVATRLSRSKKTILKYVSNGDFGPCLRLGKQDVLIPESAFKRFINDRLG